MLSIDRNGLLFVKRDGHERLVSPSEALAFLADVYENWDMQQGSCHYPEPKLSFTASFAMHFFIRLAGQRKKALEVSPLSLRKAVLGVRGRLFASKMPQDDLDHTTTALASFRLALDCAALQDDRVFH